MKYKNWNGYKVFCTGISRLVSRPRGYNDLNKKDIQKRDKLLSKEEKTEEDLEELEFYRIKHENFLYPPLSEAAKNYLIEQYSKEKYNIKSASLGGVLSATLRKGLALEQEGVELVSFLDKIKYETPLEPNKNDYLIGRCDAINPVSNKLIDIKTSWNAYNFMSNRKNNRLSFYNWCQMQGYLELYGLNKGQVCFVLVNTPQHLIDQEQSTLFKKYTFGEINRQKYEQELEKYDSIFDYSKIPISKRVIRFEVEKQPDFIDFVYKKVQMGRDYLNEFERNFLSNKNIITLREDYFDFDTEEDNT